MIKMTSSKNINTVYKNYSKYLVLKNAKFVFRGHRHLISSTWTLNDVVSAKSKSLNITYTMSTKKELWSQSTPVFLDDEVMFDVYSKCGKHRASCFERKLNESGNNDSKGNVICIWNEEKFVKCINLKDLDLHGLIYKQDFNFGGMEWIAGNKSLVYVAENKKEKRINHFQTQIKDDIKVGYQYRSKDDFGEQLDHVENPVVCILDIENEKVDFMDVLPSGYIAGQVFAHPLEEGIIIKAYKKFPYHLGLIYCLQRASELFYYDLKTKEIQIIGDEGKSKFSARFSPDGKYLIWLENNAEGPHMQCQRLMCYNWTLQSTMIVIDIIHDCLQLITGIYNLGLTNNCWHKDNRHVFITTLDRGKYVILAIDVETSDITTLGLENDAGSVSLLDIDEGVLLIKVSSPSMMPYIAVTDIQDTLETGLLSHNPISAIHKFDNIVWQFLEHIPTLPHPTFGINPFQSIFISPNNSEMCPLILALHGGPHSAFNTEFQLFFAAAAELGFSSLLVNYRGSLGYGQNCVNTLLGYVGEIDVSDCIEACENVLQKFPSKIDPSKIFLYGGSHGGFLAAHLAAKYSKRVRAMACRNPVINIPAMVTSTDIPDWTFTETGFSWDHKSILDDEKLLKMWTMSPLKYVDDIKCPVCVMVGKEDKRVPPSQGRELARALMSRGIPCELHEYPKDSHPLASVEASADCFVNVISWFMKSLEI